MLKRLAGAAKPPWVCTRCQIRARTLTTPPRRFNSSAATAAAAAARDPFPPASTKADDDALRAVFDNASFWDAFRRSAHKGTPAGIIGNKYLTHPEGFIDFVTITIRRCNAVVDKVAAADTPDDFRLVVRELDKLSDLLCRVIDLADFVRGTHPDTKFQYMATQAYATVFQYMNQLNTTPVLYDQLKRAADMPDVYAAWSDEERIVARILMDDFARFGIGLNDATRQRLVDLSDDIADVGTQFVNHMAPATPELRFNAKRMKGLDPNLARSLTRWGDITISTMHHEAQATLRFVQDPEVRRETYSAQHRAAGKDAEAEGRAGVAVGVRDVCAHDAGK
jgi:intermediate peptidase